MEEIPMNKVQHEASCLCNMKLGYEYQPKPVKLKEKTSESQ